MSEDFKNAQDTVKNLKERPSNEELLNLYALYKQGTEGDATGKRPSMIKVKERAKFDAWNELSGTDSENAKTNYVSLVSELVEKYGTN